MNLLALPLVALLAAPAAEPELWWVFLTRGPNREGSKEQLEQGQKDHIANIVRLYEAGLAPLAGPVGSDGPLRGIILVRARSREELAAHLAPDPFVAGRRLNAEASPWTGSVAALGKPSEGMQRTTLAILKKGPSWSAAAAGAMSAQHAQARERLRKEGALALDGDLTDGGDRLAVLLFRSAEPARVQAMLARDPAVKAGHFAVELHPQYIGQGMVGEDPMSAFSWLPDLAGSCWTARLPGDVSDTQCYEVQYGHYLRGTIRIQPAGGPVFEGDSLLAKDASGALSLTSWGSHGRTSTMSVVVDGETIRFPAVGSERRHAWTRVDGDSYRVVREEKQGDAWMEVLNVVYTRVP